MADTPTETDSNICNGITINLRDCKTVDGQKYAEIQGPACHATIISPSFGCPGVFAKGQAKDGKDVTLYVLADKAFLTLYNKKDPLWSSTWPIEDVINYHLKILPMSGAKECKDEFMYAKGNATANITCTLVDDFTPGFKKEDGKDIWKPHETRIRDGKEGRLVACIRESTRDYYTQGPEKPDEKAVDEFGVVRVARPYLFRIDLNPAAMRQPLEADKFYDCSWFVANVKPNAPVKEKICELQDCENRQFVMEKSNQLKPKSLFKVDNGKLNYEQFDDDSPVQAYHPLIIFNSGKTLNIGQFSDIHISSRQVAFRKSQARVLEGVSDAPTMGELVDVTLDSFSDMLEQMANDGSIDAIVLTGDLVDYNQNFMPTAEIKRPGDLWDKMHHDHHKDEKMYPRYLDSLVLFSLLGSYYNRPGWKKPIFLICGNHENYKDIYGISPRGLGTWTKFLADSSKGLRRANAGIPSDHNLTIYEACLMYGPDFGWYGDLFTKQYSDWFYRMYTPLTDFRFTFNKQSVVAVGWGSDESMVTINVRGFDHTLPRAKESLTDTQLDLLTEAAKEGEQRVLCAHFTFASYNPDIPLNKGGEIDCNDTLQKYDDFSQGTFIKNRSAVYKMLGDSKFHFTLSGHSHRAAVYKGDFSGGGRPTYSVTGHEISLDHGAFPAKGKCNMVVCGSSGPIGVQNLYDRPDDKCLGGLGLDYPSGNALNLENGTIKRIIPNLDKVKSAKPRFAVALDYMETALDFVDGSILRKNQTRVFESIVSDANGTCFTFTVSKDVPATRFIKEFAIVAYTKDKGNVYPMTVTEKVTGGRVFEARLSEADRDAVVLGTIRVDPPAKTFLHITFNDALKNKDGYKQYNYDSPWAFPIEIIDLLAEKKKSLFNTNANVGIPPEIAHQMNLPSGYELIRHPDCGEIPDFKWYSKTFGYGYDFDKKPKKK